MSQQRDPRFPRTEKGKHQKEAEITKVAAEKKLDLAQLMIVVPEWIAENGEAVKPILQNVRRLRTWLSEQFPQTDAK